MAGTDKKRKSLAEPQQSNPFMMNADPAAAWIEDVYWPLSDEPWLANPLNMWGTHSGAAADRARYSALGEATAYAGVLDRPFSSKNAMTFGALASSAVRYGRLDSDDTNEWSDKKQRCRLTTTDIVTLDLRPLRNDKATGPNATDLSVEITFAFVIRTKLGSECDRKEPFKPFVVLKMTYMAHFQRQADAGSTHAVKQLYSAVKVHSLSSSRIVENDEFVHNDLPTLKSLLAQNHWEFRDATLDEWKALLGPAWDVWRSR
jgi:hypothetical protein